MMRFHIRTLGELTFEFGGHGKQIANGTSARELVDVHRLVGMLVVGMYSIPKLPGHLTLCAQVCNLMEPQQRDGLRIAWSKYEHILEARETVAPPH